MLFYSLETENQNHLLPHILLSKLHTLFHIINTFYSLEGPWLGKYLYCSLQELLSPPSTLQQNASAAHFLSLFEILKIPTLPFP